MGEPALSADLDTMPKLLARNAARYRDGAELLRDADIAMYRAKEAGRNRVAAAPRIGPSPETGAVLA